MAEITDEFMKEMLAKSKSYCIVILKDGPNSKMEGARGIVWEHGRRNFALRRDGVMPIVCRISDDGDIPGIAILDASVDEAKKLMDNDPGVKAGIFTYEIHPCKSFPGACLP
ncbi:MAG: hypothetical protein ABSE15_08695 [Candidatus Bathyarchaeia archaeon]|jgi:hypothetical protein